MAETTKTTTVKKEERETIFVDKARANEDPNHYISINGKTWILPKGKNSIVPTYVAEEYRRSCAAATQLEEKSEELLERGKEPIYRI